MFLIIIQSNLNVIINICCAGEGAWPLMQWAYCLSCTFFLNLLDRSRTAAKRLTLRNNVTDVGMLVTQEARRCDGLQSAVFSWWLSDESSAYREVARLSLMVWKTSSQNSGSIMASTVELDGQGRKWATSGRRHFHQRSWGAILDGFTHVLCQFCQLLQDGPFIPTASQVLHR